jgi:hypothetical protein
MKTFTNFGFGGSLKYATKRALKLYFGNKYSTVNSHINRVKPFLNFCQLNDIKYAEQITQELIEDYAEFLEDKLSNGEMKVSYAHNLLSSVNELMRAIRHNNQIWVSPFKYLGPRSNIRTVAPNMCISDAKLASREVSALGEHEIAILIWLAMLLGLRLREAILIDVKDAYKQAVKFGYVDIRKGTKGGRGKRVERLVSANKLVIKALGVACNIQAERCSFIPENQMLITFYRKVHRVALPILKKYDIKDFNDLRAAFACKEFKKLTGFDAPVISQQYVEQTPEIKDGIKTISHEMGHGKERHYVLNSYCGSNTVYKQTSKAEIKMKQFLGKRLTGKASTIAKHRSRALIIAKKIDERFNKHIHQYQVKHLLWFLREGCSKYSEGTVKNYLLTIKKLVKLLNKSKDWLPILLKK